MRKVYVAIVIAGFFALGAVLLAPHLSRAIAPLGFEARKNKSMPCSED